MRHRETQEIHGPETLREAIAESIIQIATEAIAHNLGWSTDRARKLLEKSLDITRHSE